MNIPILLEKEEDGTYSVHCPIFRGCHSQGETKEEAIRNIKEAIQGWLDVEQQKLKKEARSSRKFHHAKVLEITTK